MDIPEDDDHVYYIPSKEELMPRTNPPITRRTSNEFMTRREREFPAQTQEFSDEELLVILMMAENWADVLVRPETVHDLGAHEFGKVVRSIQSKLGA